MDLPKIIIQAEQKKMMMQFEADIAQMGIKFDDYLKEVKKTKEDIEKELEKDAIKRAKTQLVLNKISEEEKIIVPEDKINEQVESVLKHSFTRSIWSLIYLGFDTLISSKYSTAFEGESNFSAILIKKSPQRSFSSLYLL